MFSWHNRADIPSRHNLLCMSVNRKECQQTFAGPSKCCTFFIIIDRESKKLPFQLQASCLLSSAAPTSLSGCLSSYFLERDSKFSFFCSLASLFDLRNSANEAGPLAGSWCMLQRQPETCPKISVIHNALLHLIQQPNRNNREAAHVITCLWKFSTI